MMTLMLLPLFHLAVGPVHLRTLELTMTLTLFLALVLALALMVYLGLALLMPERFQ